MLKKVKEGESMAEKKITFSVIKADIGSIGGHTKPSNEQFLAVQKVVKSQVGKLIYDCFVSYTGDDIAILMPHGKGVSNREVHKLAWDAFKEGTEVAKKQGLYAAGQDLLKDAFSGNVKGMGPAVAEIELKKRPSEPFMVFAADKTSPGAYSLPLYSIFCEPSKSSGLLLAKDVNKGFKFTIMDVSHAEKDKVIELETPKDLHEIAILLRDNERFVVESVHSLAYPEEQVVSVSTTRLHNIAGTYTGKDDPVMIVRAQRQFPATEEVVHPFHLGHYVGGDARGSHIMPLMPVPINSPVDFIYCCPIVSCLAFSISDEGKLTEPVDMFAGYGWEHVRSQVAAKAIEMRRQGFSGPAMLPESELEYGWLREKLADLEKRFRFR